MKSEAATPAFPWAHIARYAPFAFIGGGFIGFAMRGMKWETRSFLHGGLIGLLCFSAAVVGERLFHNWIEAAPKQWWRRALIYFIGSQIGWPLGIFLGLPLIWGVPIDAIRLPRVAWVVVIVTSLAGTLIGVGVYGYQALKERLERSIEQLKEKEFADKELELARELQSRMLPAPEIKGDGYRITARNFAARYVAGDFFDVFQYGDGSIGMAVADVAGKGIAASLIMASVKAVLPLLAMNRSVDEAMIALNEKLNGELSKREFVALTLARYDPAAGRVSFVNAGLPDPYVLGNGRCDAVEATGPRLPLGLRRGLRYERVDMTLEQGQSMLFFSDGLPEATGSDGELLGYERLGEIVKSSGADVDEIMRRIHATTSAVRDDDQTLLLLQRA